MFLDGFSTTLPGFLGTAVQLSDDGNTIDVNRLLDPATEHSVHDFRGRLRQQNTLRMTSDDDFFFPHAAVGVETQRK